MEKEKALNPRTDTDTEYDDDEDDNDWHPSYELLNKACSKLSIQNTNNDQGSESSDDVAEDPDAEIPSLDEKDEKDYLEVAKLVEGGKLDKLKVNQCKLYLRKHGLRLSGNKPVLIERIQEHLEIKDGSGEKKYPSTSFMLNCKGDACTGDIVMFEQKVYENYSIASRSATGPPIGTRLVAGRIVKESYGATKQQHTFTIEVLWSKGEKPLPPLHPFLIKGRNLYRLKTVRQPWPNEEDRRKVLQDKHSRGSVARHARDVRVQNKEIYRSRQVRDLQKEAVSASNDNDKSLPHIKPCANANAMSLPVHTKGIDQKIQLSTGNLGVGMLGDGNMIQFSQRGYDLIANSNNGYLHNIPSAAGSSNRSTFTPYSVGFVGQTRPMSGLSDMRLPQVNGVLGSMPAPAVHHGKGEHCRHFLKGRCHYGQHCKFLHDTSMLSHNPNQYQPGFYNKENKALGGWR